MTRCSTNVLLIFLFISNFIFSQKEIPNKEYYVSFDSFNTYYNTGIFNGLEHVDTYLDFEKGNHKFYHDDGFLLGSIVYDGQPYYNIKMKYDLLNDFLLIEYINQKVNYINLDTKLVSEFTLDEGKFIHLPEDNELENFYRNGFFKEVYKDNSYSLFAKYVKQKNERIHGKKVFYVFDEQNIYVLFYQNEYYRISKVKDIAEILPLKKRQILEFYKNYKKLYKNNREQFLERLFENLDNIKTNSVN